MSFFSASSDFTINGGDFLNIHLKTSEDTAVIIKELLGKRAERESSDLDTHQLRKRRRHNSKNANGLVIMARDEFNLRDELISGSGYRIHSASHGGGVVAVKVFDGPRAKKDWTSDIAFSKQLLHSNVLKLIGASGEYSQSPFLVFHGISEKTMQSMIAKALRSDLCKSVYLSMKSVKGLAGGLSYMRSKKIPLLWENFDILSGENDEPVIAIHPQTTVHCDGVISRSFDMEEGIAALNKLCQRLFSEANSILYDDSPVRDSEQYMTRSLLLAGGRQDEASSSTSKSEAKSISRREVCWRLDLSTSNRGLSWIARRFGDYLDSFSLSVSQSPLRRIRASKVGHSTRTSHQCPGYLREEIMLTSDVSSSAIVFDEYPSQSEVCLICGQLVDYAGNSSDDKLPCSDPLTPWEVLQSSANVAIEQAAKQENGTSTGGHSAHLFENDESDDDGELIALGMLPPWEVLRRLAEAPSQRKAQVKGPTSGGYSADTSGLEDDFGAFGNPGSQPLPPWKFYGA